MSDGKKTIFIIEDDQLISSMYQTKLSASGYDVKIFENGYEGLQAVMKDCPDLVMLDVMLPQMDGFSVLRELRADKKFDPVPIIIMTNLGTDEDVEKGKKAGATDYIVKANLTPSDVLKKIEEYLDK